ncbi:MAG TPA: RNA-binding protein [Paludibacteraceae bacterium]|jgi:RNA recognition motif-containing protein|nr:RNA-binding protein [Paludibacteraceae bacterium]HQP80793.1 RNA-binding protein [Paludibacteraceae bacterium]
MNIFIGSLPFAVKDEALKELFATYGEVSSARVVTDKFTGRSKGFGFVEMENEVAAKKAIAELNGSEIQGRTIVVNEAKPREERPEGGYQRRDNGFRRS